MANRTVTPPLVPYMTKLEAEGERNWVLNLDELSVAAMRARSSEIAERALDEATLLINQIFGSGPDTRAARSIFFSENAKIFKGDPYERSMAFFYRGVLYMQEGDWQNARAMFRSAVLQDAFAEEEQNRADWVIFDYLIAVCEAQLGRDFYAEQSYQRAMEQYDAMVNNYREFAGQRLPTDAARPPLPRREDNLLVIVQSGAGPQKIHAGLYGEFAAFERRSSNIAAPAVRVGDEPVPATMTDSVYYQSATRGGREFDRIQGRKVIFKSVTGAIGEVGVYTGAIVLAHSDHHEEAMAGAMIMAAGLLVTVVSGLARPDADIRHWRSLPDALGVAVGSSAAGARRVSVRLNGTTTSATVDLPPSGHGMAVVLAFDGPDPMLLLPQGNEPLEVTE